MLLSKKIFNREINLENLNKITPVLLDDRVDEYIKWYTETMVKGNYSNIGEYRFPIQMRNFIEKMAVWYELRYPDYEVNRIMPGSSQEGIDINKVMFQENRYVNELLDSDSEVRYLAWDELYNTKAFLNSLPREEKLYFNKPKYKEVVYWNYGKGSAHLYLSQNGTVEMSKYMDAVIPGISNKDFEGKNIKEVVAIIKSRGIQIPENNEFIPEIQKYDNLVYKKEEMLNCVMYRIIERGGKRIGPRRAFLFAREFKRNIDIPMMYGVDQSDPGLRLFVNEYLKAGGSKKLICYNDYFGITSKEDKINTITIQELLLKQSSNAVEFYTKEEEELHQRLVNILSSQLDQDELIEEYKRVKNEEVRRLRLQRKLEKSKNNW